MKHSRIITGRGKGGGGAADGDAGTTGVERAANEAGIVCGRREPGAVTLVDSNIFIYAAGREHPLQEEGGGIP